MMCPTPHGKRYKLGKIVVAEYAWLTRAWRDRARNLATNLGFEAKLIFIDTPENVVRKRWQDNRKTINRFDVSEKVFEDSLRLFERPTVDEDIIRYDGKVPVRQWTDAAFFMKTTRQLPVST